MTWLASSSSRSSSEDIARVRVRRLFVALLAFGAICVLVAVLARAGSRGTAGTAASAARLRRVDRAKLTREALHGLQSTRNALKALSGANYGDARKHMEHTHALLAKMLEALSGPKAERKTSQ